MTNNPENIMTLNVRIAPENRTETIKYIRETFMKYRDNREFSYDFFDDLLDQKYQAETRLRNITTAFAILAIIISVMGILGMAFFSTDRRTKEIGIRKVTGAETSEILILLNKDFVKWVGVAFLIATPVAIIVLHKWLQNFAYKTALSWWIFALAGLSAVLIAVISVSLQSWRASNRNPVEALRYE
jgi:putative ABC transport system permease protein